MRDEPAEQNKAKNSKNFNGPICRTNRRAPEMDTFTRLGACWQNPRTPKLQNKANWDNSNNFNDLYRPPAAAAAAAVLTPPRPSRLCRSGRNARTAASGGARSAASRRTVEQAGEPPPRERGPPAELAGERVAFAE
jgi:hypothetical protein